MDFIYNDGGRSKYFKATSVGDCSVRAICNATGLDYKQVYNDLKRLNNGETCRNGTPKKVSKKYLKQLGWEWVATMQIGKGCTMHLCKEELPKGILIVQVSKHLTCVKDGVIYDTYNCSYQLCYDDYGDLITIEDKRCVYGYWYKKEQRKGVR